MLIRKIVIRRVRSPKNISPFTFRRDIGRKFELPLLRRQSSGGCRFKPDYKRVTIRGYFTLVNGIRTGYPRGFNKGRSSEFREGSRVRQIPEESRRTYRPKRYGNNNKDEYNSPKTLNDKNHQASSQKFRQLLRNETAFSNFYWDLKELALTPGINWKIIKRFSSTSSFLGKYNLCLE